MTLFNCFADWLITRSERRSPDFIIGQGARPYMRRWWLIPRNKYFNIYLHNIQRSDDDRALHDHPWWNASLVLRGAYREITPHCPRGIDRFAGSLTLRRARSAHRLVLVGKLHLVEFPTPHLILGPAECWTLFITGPRIREWGFYCPQGWRHWKDFTASGNKGAVGKGCGE